MTNCSIKRFANIWVTILMCLWVMPAQSKAPGQGTVISFGIVPQQSASKLAKTWGPILRYLSAETGMEIIFRTAPDIPTFEQRLHDGEYDIAYMNPYHFTVFNQAPGYKALAKAKEKKIHGIVVVKKDSDIQSLSDLQGKYMAFPAPAAFAASVLPQANFKEHGITVTPRYVSSHDSVYRAVARGVYVAGGGVMRTFKSLDPKVRENLKVLWKTPGYTPHAVAVHARVKPEHYQAIRQVMVGMHTSGAGIALLKALRITGFDSAEDKDWDDVRVLGIQLPVGKREVK